MTRWSRDGFDLDSTKKVALAPAASDRAATINSANPRPACRSRCDAIKVAVGAVLTTRECSAAGAIPATNVSAAGTAVGYGAYAARSSPSAATCGSAPGGKSTSDSSGVIGSISGVSIEAPLAAIGAAAGPIGSDIGYAAADSVDGAGARTAGCVTPGGNRSLLAVRAV